MPRRFPGSLVVLCALGALALSCATSEMLTRRSERQLVQGDARKALESARDALEKDPHNAQARAALAAAGTALLGDAQRRYVNVVPVDTLAGARIALDVDDLRVELSRLGAPVPLDTGFVVSMRRAKEKVADDFMAMAADSLAEHRARPAYRLLEHAAEFAPHRRDLDARLKRTFELAVDRVAVLPLDDQIEQPALPRVLADRLAADLRRRIDGGALRFTRLVEPERVYARMTVSQLGDLSREQAVRIGRQVGATVVVWGRLHDAGTDHFLSAYREPIWHRVTETASDGTHEDRWVEVPFETVVREKVYHLTWDLLAIDVDQEIVMDQRRERREARARAVWTSFRPEDEPDRYALVPPNVREKEPDRAKQTEESFGKTVGKWTLPQLLEKARARDAGSRSTYRHEYRHEYENAAANLPVFMGGLPDTDDMAWLALRGLDASFNGLIDGLDRR